MKHLSIWLTVLLLGGVAPTAAALDYGSNSVLLAADNNATSSPGASRGEADVPVAVDAGDSDGGGDAGEGAAPAVERPTRSAAAMHIDAPARSPGPSASGKPRPPVDRQPPPPATASWQSLLPGSIQ